MTEYVYGTARLDTGGRVFRNARFFDKPEADATAVTIVGQFPAIENAYGRLGVPVRVLDSMRPLPAMPDAIAAQLAPPPMKARTTGLTKREICADLEAMDVEFDPRAAKAELLVLRDTARSGRAAG